MSLSSGCGLQAEPAHFVSAAIMNLTVSSSGDPHRDSCAIIDDVNPSRKNRVRPKAGIINLNFMALISGSSPSFPNSGLGAHLSAQLSCKGATADDTDI